MSQGKVCCSSAPDLRKTLPFLWAEVLSLMSVIHILGIWSTPPYPYPLSHFLLLATWVVFCCYLDVSVEYLSLLYHYICFSSGLYCVSMQKAYYNSSWKHQQKHILLRHCLIHTFILFQRLTATFSFPLIHTSRLLHHYGVSVSHQWY